MTTPEAGGIEKTPLPLTVASLTGDFKKLGIESGMTLLVHSSLSSLGWVCGGAMAVIISLEDALGETGTLVMPAHTGDNSDPASWRNPPVPEAWWDIIRTETPAFDAEFSPARKMGAIAETFRKQPGTLRSRHPQVSFAARGLLAETITVNHPFDYALGDDSPLGRLCDLGGYIMLLGVGHMNNTSLHLAEYRATYPGKRIERGGAAVMDNGRRAWKILEDFGDDSDDFNTIGEAFEKVHPEKITLNRIGQAEVRLMPSRDLIDFAVEWMNANRK